MLINAAELTASILAVAPIFGVSIGDPNDKTTWIIWFQNSATSDQQTSANTLLQNYSFSS